MENIKYKDIQEMLKVFPKDKGRSFHLIVSRINDNQFKLIVGDMKIIYSKIFTGTIPNEYDKQGIKEVGYKNKILLNDKQFVNMNLLEIFKIYQSKGNETRYKESPFLKNDLFNTFKNESEENLDTIFSISQSDLRDLCDMGLNKIFEDSYLPLSIDFKQDGDKILASHVEDYFLKFTFEMELSQYSTIKFNPNNPIKKFSIPYNMLLLLKNLKINDLNNFVFYHKANIVAIGYFGNSGRILDIISTECNAHQREELKENSENEIA